LNKLKLLDLFSGIGGLSSGLEKTGGFETRVFCEIDIPCQKVLRKHWPNSLLFGDIREIVGSKGFISNKTGSTKLWESIDVICGGFPCQDISVANVNGEGLDGKRSGLWFEYKRLIQEIKPRYAIIENVANLRIKGLATVLKDLWEIGYDAEWHIISACGIGAIHRRERVWILAYPRSKGLEGSRQTRDASEICPQKEISSCFSRQTFERGAFTYPNDLRLWSPFTSEKEKQEWWSETTSSFSTVFGKIISIEPTVCRGDDGVSRGLDKNRKERIKQLGNSVVPQIAEWIGQRILEYEALQAPDQGDLR